MAVLPRPLRPLVMAWLLTCLPGNRLPQKVSPGVSVLGVMPMPQLEMFRERSTMHRTMLRADTADVKPHDAHMHNANTALLVHPTTHARLNVPRPRPVVFHAPESASTASFRRTARLPSNLT
eukprot:364152-Chlamydomonas_euryale.AAC.4